MVQDDGAMFTATAFGGAALMGIIYRIYTMIIQKRGMPSSKDVLGGVALGLPNYLTIYLLVVLLSQGWEGSVLFPINSIGIIVLTSIVGVLLYQERLGKIKLLA